METFHNFILWINAYLWDYILIILLCGTGIYYTLVLGFIQIRKFPTAFKALFKGATFKKNKEDGVSSFQAAMTAIAGQVGTGNLAGPATAIIAGGPGAIFWIWVSSFLGMATIYAEAILAQKFKTKDKDGNTIGGPAYYIEHGLKMKWLAVIFSVLAILALGIIGNMVQSNSIASAFHKSFNIPLWVTGVIVALVTGFVIIGGIKKIVTLTEKLVPTMAVFYILGAFAILAINYEYILLAFKTIFIAAFNPSAMLGAGAGIAIQHAMRFGIARGLFSNEAGMGSTPHAHAIAKVKKPEDQAFVAMMGVFVVCFIVTITGLVILTSALKEWIDAGNIIGQGSFLSFYEATGIEATQQAYESVFGSYGAKFIAISVLFFAFSTIIGWYYYAETNIKYLIDSKKVLRIYQGIVVIGVFLASLFKVKLVWDMVDTFNGLMVLPNLVAILLLSPLVIKIAKESKSKNN